MQVASNRKSKVELLPEEIRNTLNVFIRSGNMTQKDILEAVNQMIDEAGLGDDAKLSRTGFNRYAKRMEDIGAKIRESREIAEVWAEKLGEAPVSHLGKMLQEAVRVLSFEFSMAMLNGETKPDLKALNQLALVAQRVEQAAMASQKVEKEHRAAFAAEAAEAVDKIAKQAGISDETATDIKNRILGIV
ncbi:DUF3486 family protein [Vibrio cholerae]|nr:DUF3486 family protein [Vibrio cholerae]